MVCGINFSKLVKAILKSVSSKTKCILVLKKIFKKNKNNHGNKTYCNALLADLYILRLLFAPKGIMHT